MDQHILHLIETAGPGGAERMLINMVGGLGERGIRSTVVLLKDGWLHPQLVGAGAEVLILPQSGWFDVGWIRQLRAIVRERNAQLLHAHEFAMNFYAAVLSKFTAIPAITTVHGRSYYADRLRRRLAYRFAARNSTMVPVSRDLADFLVSRVGIPKRRLTVIPNGIDLRQYEFDPDLRTQSRRQLGYGPAHTVAGAVGNLYHVKGHEVLIRAAALLAERHPDFRIFIAGRGREENNLRALADKLGVAHIVQFLGFREDVHAILCACDVFVLPSLSEGHPLSLLEAMACRRPVVGSNVGGIPEVITDGLNGRLFPVRDHAALAATLSSVLTDPEEGARLARRARESVSETYGIDAMISAYLALYRQRGFGVNAGTAVREGAEAS